jgi:hypothetical protein
MPGRSRGAKIADRVRVESTLEGLMVKQALYWLLRRRRHGRKDI